MTRLKSLEALCYFLDNSKLYWEELVERYKQHPEYSKDKEIIFSEYERAFKDNYLKNALDKISKKGLSIMPFVINSRRYYSRRDGLYRVHIYRCRGNKKSYPSVSYENLIKVDSVPTIIESCIARFVPEERLEREERIILKEFGRNYTHIIVLPESFFTTQPVRKFLKNGGLICRFPLSREKFRGELAEALEKYNFKIKSSFLNKAFK